MTQEQINDAISHAFRNLSALNQQIYDYWATALYLDDGNFRESEWNEETLKEMEEDVMHNS